MMMSNVTGTLGMVHKIIKRNQEEVDIRERIETIQTTAVLRSAKNTQQSPDDLIRMTITQIPEKDQSVNDSLKNSDGEK